MSHNQFFFLAFNINNKKEIAKEKMLLLIGETNIKLSFKKSL